MLRSAHGEINLDFLYEPLEQWLEKHRILALEENNRARDILRRRSAVIGFRAVLCFAPLYNLNKAKIRENLTLFALDIAELVLNSQLAYFGDRLNNVIDAEYRAQENKLTPSQSVFQSLSEIFNAVEVDTEMKKRNMSSPARQIIWRWVREGLVEKIDKKQYKKIT